MNANKLLTTIKNLFISLIQGKLLMRLKIERYFPQILLSVFLIWLTIFVRIITQNALAEVEVNKTKLSELKIKYAQKTIELSSFNRLSKIEKLLNDKNSSVGIPTKPANIIEK